MVKLPVPWSCSQRAGVGAAGFQGAASGAEIYTVLDRKSTSTAPVCSWCIVWRQPLLICLFSSPTRFSLALGIRCPGTWGIGPVQGQNILLKYFLSIKMTGTFFLRLLPASSWSRAKNEFLMCSIFLFTTWKAAHRAAYRFSSGTANLSHTQPPPLGTVNLLVFFFKPGLFKVFFVAAKMLPAYPLTTLHQTHENHFMGYHLTLLWWLAVRGKEKLGQLHPKLTFRLLCLHVVRNLWLCCTLVTPSSFAAACPHVPLCKAEYGIFQTLSFKRLSKPLKMLWKQLENKRFFVLICVFQQSFNLFHSMKKCFQFISLKAVIPCRFSFSFKSP